MDIDELDMGGGGRKQILFIKNNKTHQRFVKKNKKGNEYIKFDNKNIPLNKLKIIAYIRSKSPKK